MKKILILFLLLLNLHVITGHGDLSVGFGTISAQTMLEEQLEEVVVTGSLYVDCDLCRGSVVRADLEYHKQNDCPGRTIICEFCHMSYKAYEGHSCNGVGDSGGNGGPSGGSGGGSGGGGGSSGGNGGSSSSGNTGQKPLDPPNDPSRNITIDDLKKKNGVKLVKDNKYMPDKLHPQTRKWECVARSYAFIIEMGGFNYDTAFNRMDDIAKQKGIDFRYNGILPKELTTFFEDYCTVEMEEFDPPVVESYINQGIPVGVVALDPNRHMVTVIGYDNDFYYTSAGNNNGHATIYPKGEFYKHGNSYRIIKINLNK